MQYASSAAFTITGAAVPGVGVVDHHAASRRGKHNLIGMGLFRVGQHLLW